MNATQKVFRVRRSYNQWVNNQTLEDYALRFTANGARKWSLSRVANTALGAISFLALEAIGGAITLSYGFENASLAIIVVCSLIFLAGVPICFYAAKYGVDIDLLTRGAGFGYIGSTTTSLIYASFTFIFFALEAAIMAKALELIFGIPLPLGYILCSLVVIPIVLHGITLISQFQLWTQPIWVVLQLIPVMYIFYHEFSLVQDWTKFEGIEREENAGFNIVLFGAGSAVLFSLVAQIGEQVDYLRFLPEKTQENKWRWWAALLSAGPGWIIVGGIKIFLGGLLAYILFSQGYSREQAADPAQMYLAVFSQFTQNQNLAFALGGLFVVISQIKINVTNAYAGSIAWSNFFSRLTHNHPGRVVWLVFNVLIALLLMELGVYEALENTLGIYAIVAVAWVSALVADLVINKPLKLSPNYIEFKRAHLPDINPVGVGAMTIATMLGMVSYLGVFGEIAKALAHFIAMATALILVPLIAFVTKGKYYLARSPYIPVYPDKASAINECCICQNHYEREDIAFCPAYDGPICSLCCSLDSRCRDICKSVKKLPDQFKELLAHILPNSVVEVINSRILHFFGLLFSVAVITAVLLALVYTNSVTDDSETNRLLSLMLWKVYFVLLIISGVISWLFVLAHESRVVAQEESMRQNLLLQDEINAHSETDKQLQFAKERAEAANHAKSRYLTGISHELRTPLNSIVGYAQLLESNLEISEDKRHQISVIRRSGEHLADLIEGLLDISKIEAGRLDLHRDHVRINSLMEQLVYMFRLQAEEKGLAFHYECRSKLPEYVATDEKRLRQILINLLSNAVKFTEKGKVTLSVKYKNQVAEFRISDSGIGIPPEERERIFKPFERVLRPGAPFVHGTGLGLTITKLLTDILGGEIEIIDNPEGGTTFVVLLMLSHIVTSEKDSMENQRLYGYEGERKSIMIVDDDPSHRNLVSDILAPLGFIISEAHSAQHCLESCEEFLPDLFLLDISMPEVNGLDLAKELKQRYPDKRIIMISAVVTEKSGNGIKLRRDCDDYDDYLGKPIKIQPLLQKVGAQLNLSWKTQPPVEAENVQENDRVPSLSQSDLPDQELIDQLIHLVEIGHLTGIKYLVSTLADQGSASEAFISQMKHFTNQVNFDGIKKLLVY